MKICVIGMGGIGSCVALRFALDGKHEVTVVARGKRLTQLQRDQAVVHEDGRRGPVQVAAELDTSVAYDLVLVVVLAHQVDVLLALLGESKAATVMFMFSTFGSLNALAEAVGVERFAFGFPGILSSVSPDTGLLRGDVHARGPKSMVSEKLWVSVFNESGIRCRHEPRMEDWLKNQYVFAFPLLWVLYTAHFRKAGLPWADCKAAARAIHEGQAIVKAKSLKFYPFDKTVLYNTPARLIAALFWTVTRVGSVRTGAAMLGPGELDEMLKNLLNAAKETNVKVENLAKLKV